MTISSAVGVFSFFKEKRSATLSNSTPQTVTIHRHVKLRQREMLPTKIFNRRNTQILELKGHRSSNPIETSFFDGFDTIDS